MTTEEKLQHFAQSTMEQARAIARHEIEEYQEALDKIFTEHKEEKCRQARLQIDIETESLKKENNKTLSQEHLHIRRALTKKHNLLKDKLFTEVRNLLDEYMGTPAYQIYLAERIREALAYANGEEVRIYIDPADAACKSGLEAQTGAHLTVSDYSFGGGIRAIIINRNILIDHSFDSKLEEAKENFRFGGGKYHA